MHTIRLIAACATATLAFTACSADSNTKMPAYVIVDSGTGTGSEDAGDSESCLAGDAAVTITKSTLVGSLLTLQLELGGGCETHSFSVGWSGAVATSDPPRVPLEINHYAQGDRCLALFSQSIVIDLSSLAMPTWIDLVDPEGKAIMGATAVFYEGPRREVIPDNALKVRRECSHATF